MKGSIFYMAFLLFMVVSCNFSTKKRVPDFGENVNEQYQDQKVKKLSEADIVAKAAEIGGELAAEAQAKLIAELQKAIQEKGLPGAVEHCHLVGIELVEKVGKEDQIKVARTALKYRNPDNKPTEAEMQILEAYQYNAENQLPLEDNVQFLNNKEQILFTRPIKLAAPMCLNCHGTPNEEIGREVLEKIRSIYPNDQATGFKLNDFRGMWSIQLPKKAVVKRLNTGQ